MGSRTCDDGEGKRKKEGRKRRKVVMVWEGKRKGGREEGRAGRGGERGRARYEGSREDFFVGVEGTEMGVHWKS